MPILVTKDHHHLGITPVEGVRTGIVVEAAGSEPALLIQFKRADGTTTPSYTLSPDSAIKLIENLSNKLTVLADPAKFAAFAATSIDRPDNNPAATK